MFWEGSRKGVQDTESRQNRFNKKMSQNHTFAVVVHTIAVVVLPEMSLQTCSKDDTKPQRRAPAQRSGRSPAQNPSNARHTPNHTCDHWVNALRRPAKRLQRLCYLELGPPNFRAWVVASTRTVAGRSEYPRRASTALGRRLRLPRQARAGLHVPRWPSLCRPPGELTSA